MDKFKLDKAVRALKRVEKYLGKQKLHKVPANLELVRTLRFVIKTLKEIDTVILTNGDV